MKNEFITYKLALRMKALGFDEPCLAGYSTSNENLEYYSRPLITKDSFSVDVPLYQQAFKWFREKYNYHHYIEPIHRDGKVQYEYCVVDSSDDAKEFNEDDIISTYEEAELECLKKLIEIVESKKEK
jgi:hypothetical protein